MIKSLPTSFRILLLFFVYFASLLPASAESRRGATHCLECYQDGQVKFIHIPRPQPNFVFVHERRKVIARHHHEYRAPRQYNVNVIVKEPRQLVSHEVSSEHKSRTHVSQSRPTRRGNLRDWLSNIVRGDRYYERQHHQW